MDEEGRQFLQKQWNNTMLPFGYKDYDSSVSIILNKNQKRFGYY